MRGRMSRGRRLAVAGLALCLGWPQGLALAVPAQTEAAQQEAAPGEATGTADADPGPTEEEDPEGVPDPEAPSADPEDPAEEPASDDEAPEEDPAEAPAEPATPAEPEAESEQPVEPGFAAGTYYISAAGSVRQVMDVKGGSSADRANVQMYGTNTTQAQRWCVTYDENGYATIACVGSGKVLDVAGGVSADRRNVQQYQSNGTVAQKWIARPNADGTYTFVTAIDGQRVLDRAGGSASSGTNVQLYRDNGTAAQKWVLTPVSCDVQPGSAALADGWYTISSALGSSRVLDVASASTASGANIQLYQGNGSAAQLFYLEQSGGYYRVRSCCSGLYLDAEKGNTIPGTNVRQCAAASDGSQQWALQDRGDGTFSLVNRASGLALDVAGGKTANKTNIQVTTANGSAAQRFSFASQSNFLDAYLAGPVTVASALKPSSVLDVASGSTADGANVQLYQSNSTLAQKWQLEKVAENTYALRSVSSGKYLALDAGGNVCQRAKAADGSPYWTAQPATGGYALVNVRHGKALDVAGGKTANRTNIQGYALNGTKAQSFSFASTSLLTSGTYSVRLASASGLALDVASASGANGANVQLYSWNGSGAQKWAFTRNADGSYTVLNCESEKALDVKGGTAASGTNVQQYTSNGTRAQKWNIVDNGDGTFSLASVLRDAAGNTYVLDVGSAASGSNACLRPKTGAASQRFAFSSATYLTTKGQAIVRATSQVAWPGDSLCALWVSRAYQKAGYGYPSGDACDLYWKYCTSSDRNALVPGMIIAVPSHPHTAAGKIWGHVGIYIGHNTVRNSLNGAVRDTNLGQWIAHYGATHQVRWGWAG